MLKRNSPLPKNLNGESKKAATSLKYFLLPQNNREKFKGIDSWVPKKVLDNAKGLAILTIIKAGFIWSGRLGSGLVVARLPDRSWSAPTCIGTGAIGFGLQIGAELTDFLMILNNDAAVRAFSHGGNVSLGANLSIAAGPVGRNTEVDAMVTIAAVWSYSRTGGLFAGISLEGSVLVERKDANKKCYGRKVTAKELLLGQVAPPLDALPLYEVLYEKIDGITDWRDRFKGLASLPTGPPPPVPSRSVRTVVVDMGYDQGVPMMQTSDSVLPIPPQGYISTQESYSSQFVPPPQDSDLQQGFYSPNTYPQSTAPMNTDPVIPVPPNFSTQDPQLPNNLGGAAPPIPSMNIIRAKGLYPFTGIHNKELNFEEGDIMFITKQLNNDWWWATMNGKEGLVPVPYVEVLGD